MPQTELAAIAREHHEDSEHYCYECGFAWPCYTVRLLNHITALVNGDGAMSPDALNTHILQWDPRLGASCCCKQWEFPLKVKNAAHTERIKNEFLHHVQQTRTQQNTS